MTRFFFFFQAEDGIRDATVTGVQTCALPIFHAPVGVWEHAQGAHLGGEAVDDRRVVRARDAEEHEQAGADRRDALALHAYGRAGDPLHERTHGPAQAASTRSPAAASSAYAPRVQRAAPRREELHSPAQRLGTV